MATNTISSPPHISRIKAFMDSPRMMKNPIQIFKEYSDELGGTYAFHFGGIQEAYVTTEPEVIQHVLKTNYENYNKSDIQTTRMKHFLGNGLLTSHGKFWTAQRRMIQQGFHREQLAIILDIMRDVLDDALDNLEVKMKEGPVDIYHEMMRTTFKMATRSLFSTDLSKDELETIGNGISTIQGFLVKQISQPYLNPWFSISGAVKKHDEIRAESDAIIFKHVKRRRVEKGERNDLLQILLDSYYGDTGEPMTDEQVLNETMQLLVAGHETSSNAVSWTMYLLSKHPEVVKKLNAEIESVLGDAPLQFADLPKLEYTSAVLNEAMRLYPPFWMVDRVAVNDDKIGDLEIKAGTQIIVFIYGVHHAAKYWENPEEFNPERFSKENSKKIQPFSHIPFGGGPRGCIGGNYAMMQMQLILTTILRRYNFEIPGRDDIEMRPMLILRPKDGIKLKFTKLAAN